MRLLSSGEPFAKTAFEHDPVDRATHVYARCGVSVLNRARWRIVGPLMLGAISFLFACDATSTAKTAASGDAQPGSGPVVRAELRKRPADFPSDHVRAALAWVDGRPLDATETSGPDDLRELRFTQNSDVSVEVRFPLAVRVPIEPVEPMHYMWLASLAAPEAVSRLGMVQEGSSLNSIPQAEVVVYFDANHNQQLDLLGPGEPGPGPDRVLAVASGRDASGRVVRNVVVNKRAPFEPPLELFVDDWGSAQGKDGLFVVNISVGPDQPLAQQALLMTHGITMSNTFDKYWARNMAQRDFVYTVGSLEDAAPIPLFAVTEERRSWLARGCVPYPTGFLGYAKPPPDGAAVQCGADILTYASNPDDYCGQSDTLKRLEWQGDPDLSWWPCAERGLDPEAPYLAARRPLGTSALSLRNSTSYIGVPWYEPPTDFRCRADIIYDFDVDPKTHLPALPPPAGSQVMCYGHDALSFIPADADCKRKFTYDLSSDEIPGYSGDGAMHWDLRDAPPAWWPCDEQGELDPNSGYVAPESLPEQEPCPAAAALASLDGDYPPPPHSKIRCTSATSLRAVPLWSDHCDGRTETALRGQAQTSPIKTAGWEQEAPNGWPCDANGNFVPANGYEPL